MNKGDIGLIGLAVMGENLALNMESHGFTVSVFNRTTAAVDRFVAGRGKGKNFIATRSIAELADSLKKPRKVFLMIKAGDPVDMMIETLLGVLEKGDIIIDGGNSNYMDTIRRTKYVEGKGLFYIGTGVSGGEEGALKGPSIMPGGSREAFDAVKDILQSISAKTDGEPCCQYVGSDGAGHFVKMVHNGIEYGDMQLICEAYAIMRKTLGVSNGELGKIFEDYDKSKLSSYLVEITSKILQFKDENNEYVIDKILDCAGQKGTGKWACMASLDEGIPLTLISEAVSARSLSSMYDERQKASKAYGERPTVNADKAQLIKDIENALYAAKIISYAQGYTLMASAAKTYNWDLNFGEIALMWRGGCIIRSVFLGEIKKAYDKNPKLTNLLLDDFFKKAIEECAGSLRRVCILAIENGIAVPSLSAALSYLDGFTTSRSPANLLQAQRDFFGAHTYERVDRPRGEFFHTNWTGEGGNTTSSTYNA